MGYRLHVARRYQVEYALGDAFNYKCKEFHGLLSACGIVYAADNEYDSDFEVDKDEWCKAIDKLRHPCDLEDEEREEINGAMDGLECSAGEVVRMMEYYLEHGDPDNDFLHLSFF